MRHFSKKGSSRRDDVDKSSSASKSQSSGTQSPSTSSLATQITTQPPSPQSDCVVNIQVGQPGSARSFQLSRKLLSSVSAVVRRSASSPVSIPIDLPRDDPTAFELFVRWLEFQDSHVPYEKLCYSDEPWRSKAINAWILASRIKADLFETYALSQFILNCSLADLTVWELIEQEVQEQSSMRRFSNHWIAWNCWLAGPEACEYSDLKGARFKTAVRDETIDPRTYDLHHWYSPCGDDLNACCNHHPVTKTPRLPAVSPKAVVADDDLGREWETKRQLSPTDKSSKDAVPKQVRK